MAGTSTIETGTGRKLFSALVFLFGTLATLGTALGFFGASWWGFDRLADLRFPFLVILVVTAVVYGFVFRRALSALFLLAAVVNAVLLAPLWLSPQDGVASNDRIRVVSLDTGETSENRRAVIDWISQEEADIALLHRTSGDWATTLDDSDAPYRIVAVQIADEATGTPVILVRNNATASALPPAPGSDFTVRVVNETSTVTLIGLSVRNPSSSSSADDRIERFTAVNEAALSMEGPIVVAGNLEASRWSHAFKLLSEGMTNSEDGFGYAATWPPFDWPIVGNYTGLPIDHAVYTGEITVPYRRVGPALGPSHRPLLFDISPSQ
ncbi:MAG: endonuclease/exonuclease/phosphatase family protein [Acidimicrobiia bacterium]